MKIRVLLATACLLLTGCAGMSRETREAYYISPPDTQWEIRVPSGYLFNTKKKDSADGKAHMFGFVNLSTQSSVLVFIEPATKCKTAADCRDLFWKSPGKFFTNPKDVSFFDENGYSVVRCITPANGLIHYSAHQVRDGYWIELRVEKLYRGPADKEAVADLASIISVQPKNAPAAPASPKELNEALVLPRTGVSINFEGTQGWTQLNNPFESRFFKYINKDRLHTAVIRVYSTFPPRTEFSNLDAFYKYANANIERLKEKDGTELQFSVAPNTSIAPMCVLLQQKLRTKDERNAPGKPLLLQNYDYICSHPKRPGKFVRIHYSERFFESDNVTDVDARANAVFKHITFVQ